MRFNAWFWLLLLPLVPALVLLYAHAFGRRRRALALFVEQELAPRVLPPVGDRHRWVRASCLIGAAACFIAALMQPQWGTGEENLGLRGRDLVVVLDVSLSMLAEDAAPSRLARAKAAARSLVEALRADGGHRVALLTFAGRAEVQCPFTRDYALFLDRLEAASVERVAQRGSSIGAALAQAPDLLGGLDPAHTDLILLSDGEDHGGEPVEAARRLAAQGFGLHTVGIGDPSGAAPVPIGRAAGGSDPLVYQGAVVETRMRKGTLTAMAEAAGGVYVPVETGGMSLDRLYRDRIVDGPRREVASGPDRRELSHRYQPFVALALILLGLEMVMREPRGNRA